MNDLPDSLKPAARELQALWEELKLSPDKDIDQTMADQSIVLARYQPLFSPLNIASISEEEFYSFLLLENNRHWSGLHRQGSYITADMPKLRKALAILLDESQSLQSRLDRLIARSGPMIPHLGRAVLTAILLVSYPDKYGVWNGTSEAALTRLGVWPAFERGASFGERYQEVNRVLLSLAGSVGVDLWTLDSLWWRLLRATPGKEQEEEEEIVAALPEAQRFGLERYLHDFLRDNWGRIADFREWSLYEEDGELVGYEYITNIGRIDLLAKHKTKPQWLVVELKRNQSSDETLGQMLRYMGWVSEKLAQPEEEVQGLIISNISDERLHYALKFAKNVDLMLYEVDFHLNKP